VKGSDEVVYVAKRAKEHKPNDYRLTMDFGIENRTLQYLVLLVLRELRITPSQYQTNPTVRVARTLPLSR
jgi:hypothetical protein